MGSSTFFSLEGSSTLFTDLSTILDSSSTFYLRVRFAVVYFWIISLEINELMKITYSLMS